MSFLKRAHWSIFSTAASGALSTCFPSMGAVFQLKGHIISSSEQSEIFAHRVDNKTYFIKRYFKTKGLASWFGFSRFQQELRNQLWFNQIQIPAAKVIAYGEERFMFKTKKGVLILEGIKDAVDLAMLAKTTPKKFNNRVWRNQLILKLATILRTLHMHRFCHNDMHWRNILIQESKADYQLQAYLIDCPSGKKIFWPFLNYKKLKDLANIDKLAPQYLSRTERLRFFYTYRNITKLNEENKKIVRDVLKHKMHRLKRKAREEKQT